MPDKSLFQKLLLSVVVGVGLLPIFYFVSVEIGIAEAASPATAEMDDSDGVVGRYVENLAFGIEEKLSFDINYGFINAGTATLEVANLIEYENRPCYQIISRANSNSFFSTFYKVDDRVESLMDAIGMFSWRFEKNLSEGSYRSHRTYTFDQRNQVVHYKGDTISVAEYVQDALSVLYYIRTQDMKVGDTIYVDNFTDGKHYPLKVVVHKRETMTVEAGTFDCLLVEPMTRSVGLFKQSGKLKIWVTDDRLKMPVLMKSKVVVGSISAELTDYQLGELEAF